MIDNYGFGRMTVSGTQYSRDIKIVGGRVIPDWRRQKGHRVSPEDVAEILDDPPDILVIGRGRPGLMRTEASLKEILESKGIHLIEEGTASAVKTFNRLYQEGKNVAAGFHLTC